MRSEYEFTLSRDAGLDKTLAVLGEYGMVHIPDFVSQSEIAVLRDEFEGLFAVKDSWLRTVNYEHGRALSVHRDGIDTSKFPVFAKTFGDPIMKHLTDQYLGTPNLVNNDIYVTNDKPNPEPINPLHFDKILSLKFFLYLLDTTQDSGAFQFVPKSHKIGRELANEHLRHDGKMQTINNRTTEQRMFDAAIPIEGPAGTMIIFDTDGYHRGGVVQPGKERMVMRGHSHTDPMPVYKPKLFTGQWWHEFPLNPARFSGKVPAKRIWNEEAVTK